MTMAHKILASRAGVARVEVGDIVVCDVDMAVELDLSLMHQVVEPARVAFPDRVAVILDHVVPAATIADAAGHSKARNFVREFGIERFFDVGNHGICHQVIAENALARPGQILACTDSHTVASGVFNCAARGLGSLELTQIIATGKTWFRASPTIRVDFVGSLPEGVFGKDIFLVLADLQGSAEGHDIEFGGPGLVNLGIDDRATLATMCAELSANFALFPADEVLLDYLRSITDDTLTPVESDSDVEYAARHEIDLSTVVPHVALPDFIPNNTLPVSALPEPVAIHQAFIGSCANGKPDDLRVAATILDGRKVAPGVRLIVTPASQKVYLEAVRRGYVETLVRAGAVVTNSTCGACYGGHMGVVGPGEVCVTSSTRNFKGRMGSPDSSIYIASSATVAASAIAGAIVDPRGYLPDAPALLGSEVS